MERFDKFPRPHVELETRIRNRYGLHPRLACDFARRANQFQSKITVAIGGHRFSGRRVTDLLQANLAEGSIFLLSADGPDAQEAVTALDTFLRHLAVVEDKNWETHRVRSVHRHDQLCD